MPSDRFDANAGFSINNTTVFDANRNLSAVGGTFSGVLTITGAASFLRFPNGTTQGTAASSASVDPVIGAAAKIYAYRGFR
jgi:hypothetical protein